MEVQILLLSMYARSQLKLPTLSFINLAVFRMAQSLQLSIHKHNVSIEYYSQLINSIDLVTQVGYELHTKKRL